MKSHVHRIVGLIFFCLIAIGSGTSTQVIQKQNQIAANTKWSYLAPLGRGDLWIDPYSVQQTRPDVWMVLFSVVRTDGSQPARIGPNWLRLYCQTDQYEEVLLAADGVTWRSSRGILPIPANSAAAIARSSLCGADFNNMDGRRYYQVGGNVRTDFKWRYYIRDNEVFIDPSSSERHMYLILNRINTNDPTKQVNFYAEFSANCAKGSYKLFDPTTKKYILDSTLKSEPNGAAIVANILSNRACNEGLTFMKKTVATPTTLSRQSGLKTLEQQCTEMGIKPGTQAFSVCTSQLGQ